MLAESAKASRHNEERYDDSVSVTEFKQFPGRPHFPGALGREEVADYALRWPVEFNALGYVLAGQGRHRPDRR